MFGVRLPPIILSREICSRSRRVNDPARVNRFSLLVAFDDEFLFSACDEFNGLNTGRPQHFGTEFPRTSQNLRIERGTIDLIRSDARKITSANLAAFIERLGAFVGKPKTHPLFHEMRFV